jgi:hypothetical protein
MDGDGFSSLDGPIVQSMYFEACMQIFCHPRMTIFRRIALCSPSKYFNFMA